jgi:hypothetical protein
VDVPRGLPVPAELVVRHPSLSPPATCPFKFQSFSCVKCTAGLHVTTTNPDPEQQQSSVAQWRQRVHHCCNNLQGLALGRQGAP